MKSTELSKYVWSLKAQEIHPIIKWSILKRVRSIPRLNDCKLCLWEKLYIIESLRDKDILNKKSELVSKCRHSINKYMLRNVKSFDSMD